MLAISCGLSKEISLVSTPSTNIRAEPPFNDVVPRTLICAVALGLPPSNVIFKLGIAPCNPWVTLAIGRSSNTSPSAIVTAPVKFTFFWVPYPTTTTSSSTSESSFKTILKEVLPLTLNV